MANNDTLLAHLAYRIAGGAENAAVEAVAYILNRSESAKAAFNDLVSVAAAVPMEKCTLFRTQVTAEDNSRPDFVGYDSAREKRVIGEAKFWAALGQGQAKAYMEQLPTSGPSMLLFIVPEVRLNRLWDEVMEDASVKEGWEDLAARASTAEMRVARVVGGDKRLGMITWKALLGRLMESSGGEPAVQEDIHQLQGLADRMDSDEVQPFRKEELGPEFPRRIIDLARLVDEALDRGVAEDWISPLGTRWSRGADSTSSGWYLRISGSREAAWFGIHHDLWARGDCEETPLWLQLYESSAAVRSEVERGLELEATDDFNFPVFLKTGVLYEEILADVVCQLKRIAALIDTAPSGV